MEISNINNSMIGKKVNGIFTGMNVTGTIVSIVDEQYSVGVRIKLDKPVQWGDDLYTEYESTGRRCDGWGNIQYTEIINA
jgi:hypothetical protein